MNTPNYYNPDDDLDRFMADESPWERLTRWGFAIVASLLINAAIVAIVNKMSRGLLFDWLF